jgi:hypothetical protein
MEALPGRWQRRTWARRPYFELRINDNVTSFATATMSPVLNTIR